MVKIYNSLTRQKEAFRPLEPGKVRLYVCGMTVYDLCHIGHGRVLVVFDTVVRYLRAQGFDVTYVRNITDIDDKILQRAQERGEHFRDLTARYIQAMHEDAARLGVLPPDIEPRATDSIEGMLRMIGTLIDKGYAYQAANGDVYYEVSRFATYGGLSGKRREDLRAGARVEVNEAKRDPLDFVLWKAAKSGEPSWESPWGPGRPGWHIECSAMSTDALGPHFDIHGGGQDLQFPHHENEIAQSEGATGQTFVNYWMHVGFVRINEEKMSKSLGNVFTLRDVYDAYDPEVVRCFLLSSHYRSPLNFSDEQLNEARAALTRLYIAVRDLPANAAPLEGEFHQRFVGAMDDDFNTPGALAVLFDIAHAANQARHMDPVEAARLGALLRSLGGILGLLQQDPEQFLQAAAGERRAATLTPEAVEALIADRVEARKRRDWQEADRIRADLKSHGVVLEDRPDGTTLWRRQ